MADESRIPSNRSLRRAAAKAVPPPLDPEVEALLGFRTVYRATKRYDGWSPEIQRDFISALAELGNVRDAAHSLGRTESGAYKVRTSDGADEFAEAWDAALALHHRRNPDLLAVGRPSRGRAKAAAAAAPPPRPAEDIDPALELRRTAFNSIPNKYLRKLNAEREARLAGRIVEADFIVRQLTFIEIVLELGTGGIELLKSLKVGLLGVTDIVATPMSLYLDNARRTLWREMGEPDRPPLGELGQHDGRAAAGPDCSHNEARDGSMDAWKLRREAEWTEAAEAQRLWEEKARAEAAAWRERYGEPPKPWYEQEEDEED